MLLLNLWRGFDDIPVTNRNNKFVCELLYIPLNVNYLLFSSKTKTSPSRSANSKTIYNSIKIVLIKLCSQQYSISNTKTTLELGLFN